MTEEEKAAITAWIIAFCERNNIEWDKLSGVDKNRIAREMPCNVRCWRVGVPVETTPGKPCAECGHPAPLPTVWDHILAEDDGMVPARLLKE